MPQSKIILAFIVIMGFVAGYFYYFDIVGGPEAPLPLPTTTGDNLDSFPNITLDFSILDNDVYRSLQLFGESPVSPNVTGKKNIFAPF